MHEVNSAHCLNYEIIDDLYAVLADKYVNIVNQQVEQVAGYLQELDTLLQDGDMPQSARVAHALKSSAGQVGLQGIHDLAKKLEMTCLADQETTSCSDEARQLYHTISQEFDGAMQALYRYVDSK